jgi:hypothetical protein
MMKTKFKPQYLIPALVLIYLFPLRSAAQNHASAFSPRLKSRVLSGFLAPPFSYEAANFQAEQDGLSHPLKSLNSFTDALGDVFTQSYKKHDLISYRHPLLQADLNIYAGYEADFIPSGDYGFWYKGWKLFAKSGDHFRLKTDWYNGAFYGDLDAAQMDPLIDGYYKRFSKHIQLDNLSGEMAYEDDCIRVALGRGRFQLANSISGSIIMNSEVNDFAYLNAEAALGNFRLSLLHGSLMADSTYSLHDNSQIDARHYPDKYVALHQLSYFPYENLELFLGESVIYGNRGIDLNYLLPNGFWRAAEHNLWDRDNVMIFGGVNLQPADQTLIYAQFALDEFSYSKFFTNWWGNKYALQTGISRDFPNARISLEATAVRPYTYAHFMNHTMYSHDGKPLGYPEGSNVLDLSLESNIRLLPYLSWDAQFSFRKRGSEGSNWQDNYHDIIGEDIDTAQATWFAGEQSEEFEVETSLRIPFLAHNSILVGLNMLHDSDWEHKLFTAWQFIY